MPDSMSTLIVATLALVLVQIWLIPMVLNRKNFSYLLTSREEEIDTTPLIRRVDRAKINLQESLPAFLALCLLSMQMGVDNLQLATIWLGLRVVYVPLYMSGGSHMRSLVWMGSIFCMISMAVNLV
ncbi:MAPEG family protein [Porticoccaceae bacterium]|nr:MAPEG family protein [Porticoccaceae bacterium]MDB4262979.1 MAPEG family protein [Porticoccaceae bacterium]MDB4308353.1 MAPEG family protein [Porticoccaceae bacterium]MDB9952719.1 MAPEG family protein [Porticoccaceae bacterium]MDB9999930.1 MAPEG family protein [Porticoccaceae bacterium]